MATQTRANFIDVDGDLVEVPAWAVARCMLFDLEAPGVVRATDIPGFPAGVSGQDVRSALRGRTEGRARLVWRWLCCNPTTGDRDWAVDAADCLVCRRPFRGASVLRNWRCRLDCACRTAVCRACTLRLATAPCPVCRAAPYGTADPTWPLELLLPRGGTVPVPAAAVARCAGLARMAREFGPRVPVAAFNFPTVVGAAELRAVLATLHREFAPEAGRHRRRVCAWLGCQPADQRQRDWALPNADPCGVCGEAFAGFAPVRFWDCAPTCRCFRSVCRACTLGATRAHRPCPLCGEPAVTRLEQLAGTGSRGPLAGRDRLTGAGGPSGVVLTVPHAASTTDPSALPVAMVLQSVLAQAGVPCRVVASRVDRDVLDDNRWPAALRPSELHRELGAALAASPPPALLVDVHGYRRGSGHAGWDAAPFAALLFSPDNPPRGCAGSGPLSAALDVFRHIAASAERAGLPAPVLATAQPGENSVTELGLARGVPSVLLEFPDDLVRSTDVARTVVGPAIARLCAAHAQVNAARRQWGP